VEQLLNSTAAAAAAAGNDVSHLYSSSTRQLVLICRGALATPHRRAPRPYEIFSSSTATLNHAVVFDLQNRAAAATFSILLATFNGFTNDLPI